VDHFAVLSAAVKWYRIFGVLDPSAFGHQFLVEMAALVFHSRIKLKKTKKEMLG
jgi:hypothetical protein